MGSDRSDLVKRPRVLLAIRDEALLEEVRRILRGHDIEVQVDPDARPLDDRVPDGVDLVVLHHREDEALERSDVDRLNRFTERRRAPEVVVVEEGAGELERAEMLAAGAGAVLSTDELSDALGEAVLALAEADGGASSEAVRAAGGDPEPRLADFLSRSRVMQGFLELVQKVVPTSTSLLITGETGVGKERLAHAIHNEGPRREGAFVSVNCGAIPGPLLESELFGHESGSFTGAVGRRRGRFELADGGTIFLDEIGEMPTNLQVKLLTVLQRHRVQRIGAERAVPIDVRVMAATNLDLIQAVKQGRFRQDLYYRLNVVRLHVPPLRERPEDISHLAGQFIQHLRHHLGHKRFIGISEEALDALRSHPWPGNVRQLANAIEHAMVVCDSDSIRIRDLPGTIVTGRSEFDAREPEIQAEPGGPDDQWMELPIHEARREVWNHFEHAYLTRLLRETHGRIGETAKRAGIVPRSLYDKLRKHGLDKSDFR